MRDEKICLNHAGTLETLRQHEKRLDSHDQRLEEGEARMDSLAEGKAVNTTMITKLCEQLSDTNEAIKSTNARFDRLIDLVAKGARWLIGTCIAFLGVVVPVVLWLADKLGR